MLTLSLSLSATAPPPKPRPPPPPPPPPFPVHVPCPRWQLEVMSGAWFMSYTLVAFSALSRLHALFRFAVDRARARAEAHADAGLALFLASEHWAALAPLPSLPAPPTPAAAPAATEPSAAAAPTLATAKPSSLRAALIDDGDDLGGTRPRKRARIPMSLT